VKDFLTTVEEIYEIWKEVIGKAYGNPFMELNEKYLDKFSRQVHELGMTKLPIWALKKSADLSLQRTYQGNYQLNLKTWKRNAFDLLSKDKRSDIETRPDGTTWVIPGSPTDLGRKKIGPIQKYDEESY